LQQQQQQQAGNKVAMWVMLRGSRLTLEDFRNTEAAATAADRQQGGYQCKCCGSFQMLEGACCRNAERSLQQSTAETHAGYELSCIFLKLAFSPDCGLLNSC
jgi:hypothetical protein